MNLLSIKTTCAAVVLLSACSVNDQTIMESEHNAIGFHLTGSMAETRATPTTPTNFTTTDFKVYAFTSDGTAVLGTIDEEGPGHNGVLIKHNGEKWDYATSSDLRYWPEKPLNFYAVNPGTVSDNMQPQFYWQFTPTSQKITYQCINEYSNPREGVTNLDVMYAIAKGQTQSTNKSKVKLKFQHILSQVAFQAKTKYDKMEVEIQDIKINNFKVGGDFTLPADATATPQQSDWDQSTQSHLWGFSLIKDKNISVSSSTTVTDLSTNTPMLFMPQKLTQWDTAKSTTEANKANQTYLEIICRIKRDGHYVFGSEGSDGYKKMYVPFGANWEPGMRYVYTLIFGSGYDENGNPIIHEPIAFETDIEDWGVSNSDHAF